MAKENVTHNQVLLKSAAQYLVGGVSSPVRAFGDAGIDPVIMRRGEGSRLYDADGRRYIDYVLSWGSLILGHAFCGVVQAIRAQAARGTSFGTTHEAEIALARTVSQAIPCVQKIRFVNSGTEAVMGALRLARGYTGRTTVLKFAYAYHGHADYLLAKAGSGMATLRIPTSKGVPASFLQETIVVPAGDHTHLERVFRKSGRSIAAVIYEPAGGNHGVVPPDASFLHFMRRLTRQYGTLLVADEVITGFRFGYGSLSHSLGTEPDLICLGKIIGGGLPIGAYGGRAAIMRHLAPLGKVYQASTFSGNPVVMQAGLATLRELKDRQEGYGRLEELARYLVAGLAREAQRKKVPLRISRYGNMFSLKFPRQSMFRRWYARMLRQGVYCAPSEFEANFLSYAHTGLDIARTIAAAAKSFAHQMR